MLSWVTFSLYLTVYVFCKFCNIHLINWEKKKFSREKSLSFSILFHLDNFLFSGQWNATHEYVIKS